LPRSWNFSIFFVNNLITHITKKSLKCGAVVRSCKNFLFRAVAGPRSCKKKLEGTSAKAHEDNEERRRRRRKKKRRKKKKLILLINVMYAGPLALWPTRYSHGTYRKKVNTRVNATLVLSDVVL
jgi:hypothetical protein